ncbi:MAG: twitching motility protein PilT, partial [Sphaerotilus natans]
MEITELLKFAVRNKASDLHLSAGMPPLIRVHGNVRRLNVDPLPDAKVHEMVHSVMNDAQKK